MFELSTRARLALAALVELARANGESRSNEELAKTLGASAAHLSKVTQTLARAGWVEGSRGPSGGYRFSTDARAISMADVVALFEGEPRLGEKAPPAEREILDVLREIDDQARATLGSVTIQILAHPP